MGASVWFFLLVGMESIRMYKKNPYFAIAAYNIPTWIAPLALVVVNSALVPNTSLLGHLCGLLVGYFCTYQRLLLAWPLIRSLTCITGGCGYMKFLSPPERALRFVESKLKLMQRLPRYVSVDQKQYGRFGVLPTATATPGAPGVATTYPYIGSTQRLGP